MNSRPLGEDKSVVSLLAYAIVLSILLSPDFSLGGSPDPTGLLRPEYLLLPLLVVLIWIYNSSRLRIPLNRVAFGLGLITTTIFISSLLNAAVWGVGFSIGDAFDILIWFTYTAAFFTISGNLSERTAEQSLWIGLLTTVPILLLAFSQAAGFQFAIENIRVLFTERSARVVQIAPTATTSNPNTLGKLAIIPFFSFFALFYRSINAGRWKANKLRPAVWAGLSLLFFMTIILVDSRSALAGSVVGIGVVGLLLVKARIGDDRLRKDAVKYSLAAVSLILVLSIFVFDVGRIGNLQNVLADSSLRTRLVRWEVILPMIFERPFFGHGPSKQFVAEVGFEHIDSGFLSWAYHYGLAGVLCYLYLTLGAIQLGWQKLKEPSLFETQPLVWSGSVAVVGWFSGTLITWIFAGVPQSRRVFLFALIITALISSIRE
jgi:O-antigen ligase